MRQPYLIQRGGTEEHQKLTYGHQDGSPEDGATDAPVLVGNVSADEGGQIDQTGVASVDGGCRLFVKKKGMGQKQDEDGPHAVVAETFGRAGGENQVKTFGVFGGAHKGMYRIKN